jgi:hypothetical protein
MPRCLKLFILNFFFILNALNFSLNACAPSLSSNHKRYSDSDSLFSVRLSAQAGLTLAELVGHNVADLSAGGNSKPLLGFQCGISAANRFSRRWGFAHHLDYLQQGAKVQLIDSQASAYPSVFRLHALRIAPLNLFFQHKNLQLSLGPYLSLLLDAHIQKKDPKGELFQDHSIFGNPQQLSQYAQKVDGGIHLRAAYLWPNGLEISFAYQKGFLSVIENAASVPSPGVKPKAQPQIFNQIFSLSIGYVFLR